MEKWEYLTVIIGYTQTNEPKCKSVDGIQLPDWKNIPFRHALRIFGEDGWELVSGTSPDASGNTQDPLYVFKREWSGKVYDVQSLLDRVLTFRSLPAPLIVEGGL